MRPAMAIREGAAEDTPAELLDQSALLREGWDERGRNRAPFRVGPVRERFDVGHDGAAILRLIDEGDVAREQGLPEIAFEGAPLPIDLVHARIEEAHAAGFAAF